MKHSYDADARKFDLKYFYSADEIKTMQRAFSAEVKRLTTEVLNPDYSDFRNVITLYEWIENNVRYTDASVQGLNTYDAYSVIVNGQGICLGMTNAIRYLLNLVGVECLSISSEDGSHMWNIVKIDGQYYHLDATWANGYGLEYFCMTDAQRRANNAFPDGWFSGNPNNLKLAAPICDSERFELLWAVGTYSLEADGIHFTRPGGSESMVWQWDADAPVSAEMQ